jgi:hypothetical protein
VYVRNRDRRRCELRPGTWVPFQPFTPRNEDLLRVFKDTRVSVNLSLPISHKLHEHEGKSVRQIEDLSR